MEPLRRPSRLVCDVGELHVDRLDGDLPGHLHLDHAQGLAALPRRHHGIVLDIRAIGSGVAKKQNFLPAAAGAGSVIVTTRAVAMCFDQLHSAFDYTDYGRARGRRTEVRIRQVHGRRTKVRIPLTGTYP